MEYEFIATPDAVIRWEPIEDNTDLYVEDEEEINIDILFERKPYHRWMSREQFDSVQWYYTVTIWNVGHERKKLRKLARKAAKRREEKARIFSSRGSVAEIRYQTMEEAKELVEILQNGGWIATMREAGHV